MGWYRHLSISGVRRSCACGARGSEGEIARARCRHWQLRAYIGVEPRTGKEKTRARRFNGTYKEAQAELRKFIAELEADKAKPRKRKVTVESYAEDFGLATLCWTVS